MKRIHPLLVIVATMFVLKFFSQQPNMGITSSEAGYKYYETPSFRIKYPSYWILDKSNKNFECILYDSIKNKELRNIKLISLIHSGHQPKFEENEAIKDEKSRLKKSKKFVESKLFSNKTEYYKLAYPIIENDVKLNQIAYYWFYHDYEFILTYTYNKETELNIGESILKSFQIKNSTK